MPVIEKPTDLRTAFIQGMGKRFGPMVGNVTDFLLPGSMDDPTLGMMPVGLTYSKWLPATGDAARAVRDARKSIMY